MRDFRDVPSVEQLCLGRLNTGERSVNVLRRVDPEAIADYAVSLLKSRGVPLVGAPALVEFAKAKAMEEVEAVFDMWDAQAATAVRKVGRPRVSPERDLVLMAAFHKFSSQGLGPTTARREAAKLLGSTPSTIEKGVRRFARRMIIVQRQTQRSLEDVGRLQARFVFSAAMMLEECVEERRAMMARRAEISRKSHLFRRAD